MDKINFNLAGLEFQYVLGLLGAFIGVFLLVACLNYFLIAPILQRRKMNQRLRANRRQEDMRTQIFKTYQESQSSPFISLVERLVGWGKGQNLQRRLLQADIYFSPSVFLSVVAGLGVTGFILGSILGGMLGSLGLSLGLGILPFLFLRWKKHRKAIKFEKHMPDAMELLARSLRAGHTLQATLELASQEIPAPLGTEMRITFEEQRLGLSVPQAFRRMAERVDSRDLQFFVTAVLIQTETGGNLAEILENIGQIIRDRLTLKGKIRGLTAEGRFSALVLGLLPVLTFVALFFLNRDYIMLLFHDPMGVKVLMGGAVSIILGGLVMKKMVNIKV